MRCVKVVLAIKGNCYTGWERRAVIRVGRDEHERGILFCYRGASPSVAVIIAIAASAKQDKQLALFNM
jgi:hypothetical protein